jgi:hypothetical protein
MSLLSIIIPSKTDANLGACVRAIRGAGETATVIVVDDFDGPTRFLLPQDEPVDWQMGEKPFVFARNINIGIRATAGDVVLLNDDALLRTPHGFTAMQRMAAEQTRRARRASDGLLRMRLHPAANAGRGGPAR